MHNSTDLPFKKRIISIMAYYIFLIIWRLAPKKYHNLDILQKFQHQPVVIAAWHDSVIFLPFMWRDNCPSPLAFMASTHSDGRILAHYMQQFGLLPVLGSQKKDGAKALLSMFRLFKQNYWLMITPDGPKGPRHVPQDGIIFLAQKLSLPIVAIKVEYSGFTINKSWDKIKFPCPFMPIIFSYSEILPEEISSEILTTKLGIY